MKKVSLVCGLLFITAACTMHHSAALVQPESLINSSSEKISFPVTDASSIPAIENWIATGDLPSSAELSCTKDTKTCKSVKKLLSKRGIAVSEVPAAPDATTGNVSLTYNRVIAHNCTTVNFGCSTSINAIHMVTNREQFIKPALSDFQDAASSVRAVNRYVK